MNHKFIQAYYQQNMSMSKRSSSLPSLFHQTKSISDPQSSFLLESKLFTTAKDLQSARQSFRSRLSPSLSAEKKPRSLIHFADLQEEGFHSFKSINKKHEQDILKNLSKLRGKGSLDPSLKAEIILNKMGLNQIKDYCHTQKQEHKQDILSRLAKMTPPTMSKPITLTAKFKASTKRVAAMLFSINYLIYESNRLCWKPYFAYDAMSVVVGSRVYFIGGRGQNRIAYYQREGNTWKYLQNDLIVKPFGQTEGTLINGKVYFFGGVRFFQVGPSEVINTICKLDLTAKTVEYESFPAEKSNPRTFHGQCAYGEYLLVSGGISSKDRLLTDFMMYHVDKGYWCELVIPKMPAEMKKGFAKHRMINVMWRRKKYAVYEQEPILYESDKKLVKEEGIYLFGGEDQDSNLNANIYILRMGQPTLQIYKPTISGKAPMARKSASVALLPQYLIIHGGKNEEMTPSVLPTLHVLDLSVLNWIKVKGENPGCRCSHSMMISGNEIVILGGKNTEGLCKEVMALNFQEEVVYQ